MSHLKQNKIVALVKFQVSSRSSLVCLATVTLALFPLEVHLTLFLAVYSRVSSGFEFIRSHVCALSDVPPGYFRCDEPLLFPVTAPPPPPAPSPRPTRRPVAPTPPSADVLVQVKYDSYIAETFVGVYDDLGNPVWERFLSRFPQFESTTQNRVLQLEIGRKYSFFVSDSYGDGRELQCGCVVLACSIL